MRKTVILLLSAAFVAALPSIASAKSKRVRHHVPPPVTTESNGARLVGNALYQFIVPLEQTFGARPVVIEHKPRWRHAHKRRHRTS